MYATLPLNVIYTIEPSSTIPICGLGILLFAETSLGHRIAVSTPVATKSEAELLSALNMKGKELVSRLMVELENGGVVDHNLSDQVVFYMGLACTHRSHPNLKEQECLCQDTKMCEWNPGCAILVSYISAHTLKAMRTMEMMLGDVIFTTEKVDNGIILRCENSRDRELFREESRTRQNGETELMKDHV